MCSFMATEDVVGAVRDSDVKEVCVACVQTALVAASFQGCTLVWSADLGSA